MSRNWLELPINIFSPTCTVMGIDRSCFSRELHANYSKMTTMHSALGHFLFIRITLYLIEDEKRPTAAVSFRWAFAIASWTVSLLYQEPLLSFLWYNPCGVCSALRCTSWGCLDCKWILEITAKFTEECHVQVFTWITSKTLTRRAYGSLNTFNTSCHDDPIS